MAEVNRSSEQFARESSRDVLSAAGVLPSRKPSAGEERNVSPGGDAAGGVMPGGDNAPGGAKLVIADRAIEHLRSEQRAVLELLLQGRSVPDTAELTRVSRRTVYRWIKHDPAFAAAYNQWHEEMKESCRSRLLMLAGKATGALEKALEAGDAKSALQLLKGIGLLSATADRATDEEDVRREAEIERKRRKTEQEVAEIEMRADVARAKEEERVWKA